MTQPCLTHFFDLDLPTFTEKIRDLGMPAFTAKQVMKWIYEKKVENWEDMTNLSKANRQLLAKNFCITRGEIIKHQIATDGVEKILVQWTDDQHTESVLIPTETRNTACISSQVGCPVGCRFCASGIDGLSGNLTAGQIVQQVWQLSLLPGVSRISNVVFMGMGEPLANLDAVTDAIRILTAEWGLNIGGRKITVSTVGLPSQIRKLAQLNIPITLAISLHAPNDALREKLIPWAKDVPIGEIIEAGQDFFEKTRREVTLEYLLLGQVNDQPQHAQQLAKIAQSRNIRCNVNLIRYNEVKGLPYQRPHSDQVHQFQTILRNAGINVHLRASRGRDIAAACGQLRRNAVQISNLSK